MRRMLPVAMFVGMLFGAPAHSGASEARFNLGSDPPIAALRLVPLPAAPVTCFGKPATMMGSSGFDHLRGTSRSDVIVGLGGNDEIDGRGGNDLICGGADDDLIRGGHGDDSVDVGSTDFQELARGGGGADVLYGFTGYSNAGNILSGGRGADKLFARSTSTLTRLAGGGR